MISLAVTRCCSSPVRRMRKDLRHPEPGLAQAEGRRHIRGAHAGGEGAQAAGSDGVGISADNDIAGAGEFLGHDLVADAFTDVKKDGAVVLGELAKEGVVAGKLLLW